MPNFTLHKFFCLISRCSFLDLLSKPYKPCHWFQVMQVGVMSHQKSLPSPYCLVTGSFISATPPRTGSLLLSDLHLLLLKCENHLTFEKELKIVFRRQLFNLCSLKIYSYITSSLRQHRNRRRW